MTSSLVGSEMCIRDRTRDVRVRGLVLWRPGPNAGRSAKFGAVATSAVSYTHLTLPTICSV
eukprot:11683478-Prorocentrum_lima.AAC.1